MSPRNCPVSPICWVVLSLVMFSLSGSVRAQAPDTVYVFCYHEGGYPNGGQPPSGVFLSWSPDGFDFDSLNGGDPVFVTPEFTEDDGDNTGGLTVFPNGVRDPSIIHNPVTGKFHMVWTSNIHSRSFGYADSPDLKTWSNVRLVQIWDDLDPSVPVGRVWAPEWFYDDVADEYMVIFASDVDGASLRQFYTTTSDFVNFSTPVELYEKTDGNQTVIDAALVKVDSNQYLMATAQDYGIWFLESTSPHGPWTKQSSPAAGSGSSTVDVATEGPSVLKIGSQWLLYFDKYSSGGDKFGLVSAPDPNGILNGDWTDRTAETELPGYADIPNWGGPPRHGTVFAVPLSALGAFPEIPRDEDLDGLVDSWEIDQFGNLDQTGDGDPDDDGFTNEQEETGGSDPDNADSYPGRTLVVSVRESSGAWESANPPANTLDGSLDTRSSAAGDGSSITYYLGGGTFPVPSIEIAFYLGDSRVYNFDILVSEDHVNWTTALEGAASGGASLGLESFALPGEPIAAYVKIVGHGYGGDPGAYNGYTEVVFNTTWLDYEPNEVTLEARLPFDETSGASAADVTGSGWDGTLLGGAAFGGGHLGNAILLDGAGDYLSLPTGVVEGLRNFTVAAWVKLDAPGINARIFDFGVDDQTGLYLTPQAGSGNLRFGIRDESGAEQGVEGTGPLPAGVWMHVAVTLVDSTCSLYVNGGRVARTTTMTLWPKVLGATDRNWIGRSQSGADPYLDGAVDDFRVYGGALTETEVLELVFGGQPLLAHYLFDGSGGTVAADSSGNTLDGTLLNGPLWAAGREGNCVDLDGSDDYLDLPDDLVSDLGAFTISAWANLDAASAWSRIFDFGTGTTSYMFLTPSAGGTGTVRFAITNGGNGGEFRINGAAPLPTGVWTHVVVTQDGSAGILYVDGVEEGRNESMGLRPLDLGSTTQNWIGRSQWPDPYLDGRLDDFRIYRGAADAAEVWRLLHFGTIEDAGVAAENADGDGDGMSNASERVAGTDPNDGSSVLVFSALEQSGNDVELRFPSVIRRTYRVERSDTLEDGSWSTVQGGMPGSGGELLVTDADGILAGRRFYRIVVMY